MRNRVKLLLALGVLLVLATVASFAFAGETKRSTPSLALASENPVVVKGKGFHARERIDVTIFFRGGRSTKTASAGRLGGFTAIFRDPRAECGPLSISAIGREGSRATLRRHTIPPPCGIELQP